MAAMNSPTHSATSAISDRNRVKYALVWTLVALLLFLIYFVTAFSTLAPSVDGCSYATMARSFIRGNGMAPDWVFPINLARAPQDHPAEPFNYRGNTPAMLWPLLIAVFFLLLGVADTSVVLAAGACFVAAVPFVYLAADRLFGKRAAHLAAGLFVLNNTLLGYTTRGLSEPLFVALLAGAVYFAVSNARLSPLLFAVFATGMVLAKQTGILWALPLVLLFAVHDKHRWAKGAAAVALTLVLVLAGNGLLHAVTTPLRKIEPRVRASEPAFITQADAPAPVETPEKPESKSSWLVQKLASSPLGLTMLLHSAKFPEHALARGTERPEVDQVLAEEMDFFLLRAKINLRMIAESLFWKMTNPLVVALFWGGVIVAFVRKQHRIVMIAFLVSIGAAAVPHVMTFAWERYFHPAILLYILVASYCADTALARIRADRARQIAAVALVITASLPLGFAVGILPPSPISGGPAAFAPEGDRDYFETLGAFINDQTKPGDIIATDMYTMVSWYGDRMTVWIPTDETQLRKLLGKANIDYLLFTFRSAKVNNHYWYDWMKSLPERKEEGIEFVQGAPTASGPIYLWKTGITYTNQP